MIWTLLIIVGSNTPCGIFPNELVSRIIYFNYYFFSRPIYLNLLDCLCNRLFSIIYTSHFWLVQINSSHIKILKMRNFTEISYSSKTNSGQKRFSQFLLFRIEILISDFFSQSFLKSFHKSPHISELPFNCAKDSTSGNFSPRAKPKVCATKSSSW